MKTLIFFNDNLFHCLKMSRGGEGGSASLFYINKFGQLELLLENLLKKYLVINLKIRTVGQLIVENT